MPPLPVGERAAPLYLTLTPYCENTQWHLPTSV